MSAGGKFLIVHLGALAESPLHIGAQEGYKKANKASQDTEDNIDTRAVNH